MVACVKGKEYSVRVLFTEDGEPVIGHVTGFYAAGSNATDILPVPDSTIVQIAKALKIKKSYKNLALTRQLSKGCAVKKGLQLDLFEIA